MPNYITVTGNKPSSVVLDEINQNFNMSNSAITDIQGKVDISALSFIKNVPPRPWCTVDDDTIDLYDVGALCVIPETSFTNLITSAAYVIGNWTLVNCSLASSDGVLTLTAGNGLAYATMEYETGIAATPGKVLGIADNMAFVTDDATSMSFTVTDGTNEEEYVFTNIVTGYQDYINSFTIPEGWSGTIKIRMRMDYPTPATLNGKQMKVTEVTILDLTSDFRAGLEFNQDQFAWYWNNYLDTIEEGIALDGTKLYEFSNSRYVCAFSEDGEERIWYNIANTQGVAASLPEVLQNGQLYIDEFANIYTGDEDNIPRLVSGYNNLILKYALAPSLMSTEEYTRLTTNSVLNNALGSLRTPAKREIARFNASDIWTCPQGITNIDVYVCGGGQGGRGGNYSTSSNNSFYKGSTGGAGGECVLYKNISVTPGNDYNIEIGAGGAGGAPRNNTSTVGIVGGNSVFHNSYIAFGGYHAVNNRSIGSMPASGAVATNATSPLISAINTYYGGCWGGLACSNTAVIIRSYGAPSYFFNSKKRYFQVVYNDNYTIRPSVEIGDFKNPYDGRFYGCGGGFGGTGGYNTTNFNYSAPSLGGGQGTLQYHNTVSDDGGGRGGWGWIGAAGNEIPNPSAYNGVDGGRTHGGGGGGAGYNGGGYGGAGGDGLIIIYG